MEIHQFLPGISYGDAISNQALQLQVIIRSWGITSEIYSVSRHINPRMQKYCHDYRQHQERNNRENVAILHFSIASEINHYFRSLPDKKIVIYHNITPPIYFQAINKRIASELESGRKELTSFSDVPDMAFAVSEYNRCELEKLGFKKTAVLSLTLDKNKFSRKPNPRIIEEIGKSCINFIFVGRFVPNKKFDDVILVFNHYNKHINSNSRLFLIGSYAGTETYHHYLRSLILQLRLRSAFIVGHVNLDDLLAFYKLADIFLCMSEHEGFCMPLLESMYFDIPIIAYAKAAIPETLGDAGILVKRKKYDEIAEMAHLLVEDHALRERVVERQRERLEYFSTQLVEEKLRKYIGEITYKL